MPPLHFRSRLKDTLRLLFSGTSTSPLTSVENFSLPQTRIIIIFLPYCASPDENTSCVLGGSMCVSCVFRSIRYVEYVMKSDILMMRYPSFRAKARRVLEVGLYGVFLSPGLQRMAARGAGRGLLPAPQAAGPGGQGSLPGARPPG